MHCNITNDPFDPDHSIVDSPHGHGANGECLPETAELNHCSESSGKPECVGTGHSHLISRCGHDHSSGERASGNSRSLGIGSEEDLVSSVVENAVMRAIFPNDLQRRQFIRHVGRGAAAAIVGSVFPLEMAKSMAADPVKNIEKKDLTIGFIPITCATPIIMAEPMGFYSKHGLNAKVRKASGWAMVRDWAINKEVDAAHMLSPMPLSITLGAGSQAVPFYMPAVENINGQAITLANKHKGVKSAKDMKGIPVLRTVPVFDAQLPAPILSGRGGGSSRQGRADPGGAAAGNGGQSQG